MTTIHLIFSHSRVLSVISGESHPEAGVQRKSSILIMPRFLKFMKRYQVFPEGAHENHASGSALRGIARIHAGYVPGFGLPGWILKSDSVILNTNVATLIELVAGLSSNRARRRDASTGKLMARLYGAQRMVLQAILDSQGDTSEFCEDARIADVTHIAIRDMRDWLLTLDQDEYVDLALTEGGLRASITPKGRLALGLYRPIPTPPESSQPEAARSRSRTGRERALVVGISDYPPPISKLPAVANDVREMAKLLSSALGHFPHQNVRCLADGEATRKAVLEAVQVTFSGGQADDAVFAYLAGHGMVAGGEYYYVAHDSTANGIARNGVPLKKIKAAFDASPSRRAFLWLDFCHSGGIIPRDLESGPDDREIIVRALKVVQGQGKLIVAACTPSQLAFESAAVGHGLFTDALLKGLKGGAAKEKEVTVNSLFDYIDRQMGSDQQRPMMFGQMTGRVVLMHLDGRLILNRNPAPSNSLQERRARRSAATRPRSELPLLVTSGNKGEITLTKPVSGKKYEQSNDGKLSEVDYACRWESYRITIRKRLQDLLGEFQISPVLKRIFQALGIDSTSSHENDIKKRIVDYLMEAKDKYAIPKMVRLHEEFCKESLDRLAEKIADCIDLTLPLYFSREKLSRAWHQLEIQRVVVIEGTVATETGADIVLSHLDGEQPSFLPNGRSIPRGKSLVPMELPAPGDPSSDAEVLAILEDLAQGAGVPLGRAKTGGPGDVAARKRELIEGVRAWLEPHKILTRRTPYCAFEMPGTTSERDRLKRILKTIRELIPPLVFIELCRESETHEQEVFFIRCLNTRLESEQKRKTR